ncbi:glycoside hydrolase family 68 protein [Streptomyces sp.]|uniref:glycoside hydrolase family 68 protein n=1 Tax=Streptomyces sp. TaxID=1931 RepID=UPI002F4230E1
MPGRTILRRPPTVRFMTACLVVSAALLSTATVSAADAAGSGPGRAGSAAAAVPPPGAASEDQADDSERNLPTNPGTPTPIRRTQRSFDPEASFTAKWTRNDARQILGQSDLTATGPANSLPLSQTMPEIPEDFPDTNEDVWVWDTWPLTDGQGNQVTYRGWDVVLSLTAERNAGYTFDERHTHARIGYFYRRADIPADLRPRNGGWIYGGDLFPDGASLGTAEWSGSTRIFPDGRIKTFYTAVDFTPPRAVITLADGAIQADSAGVRFTGFTRAQHTPLLEPDGTFYQTPEQNPFFNFRDPYTFSDPQHPGRTYMVFEGNTGGQTGSYECQESDLGYLPGDPNAETLEAVRATGSNFQVGNIGLAVADNADLSQWHFLPPLLSANCVNAQTERPEVYIKDGKYYLFTISHRYTFAESLQGPDGLYGFVGNSIRSDYQPLNQSALSMGNPTNLNLPPTDPDQNPRQFQAYSHYVMPGGEVTSFIDNVNGRRGGSYAPTVRINIAGSRTFVDQNYGRNGLGAYGDIRGNVRWF